MSTPVNSNTAVIDTTQDAQFVQLNNRSLAEIISTGNNVQVYQSKDNVYVEAIQVNPTQQFISQSINTPGGSDYQVQYALDGAFDGSANFTYDPMSMTLSVPNINTTGNLTISNVGNFHIPGGNSGFFLQTDGNGNLGWAAGGGGGNGSPGGINSYVQFNTSGTFDGVNSFTFDKANKTLALGNGGMVGSDLIPNANVMYDLGNATNHWRDLYLANNSLYLGNTKLSTDGSNNINTADLFVNNVRVVRLAITNSPSTSTVIIGGNAPAGNVQPVVQLGGNTTSVIQIGSNANSNITASGGNLVLPNVSIVSGGTANFTGSNVVGGNFSNVTLNNVTIANSNVSSINNGNSNVNIPSADGNITFSANGTSNVMVVASDGVRIPNTAYAGNISVNGMSSLTTVNIVSGGILNFANNTRLGFAAGSGITIPVVTLTNANVTFGSLSNLHITGGTNGQVLSTDGNGNISWSTTTNGIGVSLIDVANTITNSFSNVTQLRFDANSGFQVTELGTPGSGNIKVSLGSSFKTWVFGANGNSQANLVASGEDTVAFRAGNGITFSTSNTTGDKFLSITANPSYLVNGNSNVVVTANGNVSTSVAGNANIVVVTGTGANVTGTLNVSNTTTLAGNIVATGANVSLGSVANLHISGGNANTATAGTVTLFGNGAINTIAVGTAGDGYTIAPTVTVNGANTGIATVTASIDGNGSVTGFNISDGGLGYNSGTISVTVSSPKTKYLQTNGSGNLSWSEVAGGSGGGSGGTPGGANTQIQFNDNGSFGAVAGLTFDKTSNLLTANGNIAGANLTTAGIVSATGNVSGGNLVTAGVANVTGDILAGANVNVTSNINASTFQNGNSKIAITANANITLTAKSNSTVVITDTGANITGTANITGNLSAGNITANIANLTTANVTGNLSAGNISTNIANITTANITANLIATNVSANGNIAFSGANVSLGAIGNLQISGSSANGQVLTVANTANGLLSWTAPAVGSIISNGNSNVSIPAANGNVTISAVGNANVVVVTGTGANISGTANITGDILAGANINVTSNINAATVQNGNSKIGITSNANITLTANSNAVVVVTSSGDGNLQTTGGNVTGYWNVSGNVIGGNLVGTLANGNSNIRITSNGAVQVSASGQSNVIIVTSNGTSAQTTIANDVTVTGNLTVQGNAIYANTETLTIEDPIIELGTGANGSILTTNDGKDRGLELHTYGNGASYNTSGSTPSGNTTIVLTSTAGIVAGQLVTCASLPNAIAAGTTVSTVNAGNIIVSAATLAVIPTTTSLAIGTDTLRFMGWSNANAEFQFYSNATVTNEVVSGTLGNVNANTFIGAVKGNLVNGNSNVTVTANGNVGISSAGNAVVVITGTGANIAGTANITGNANVGNLGTATAIITTGNITTVNTGLVQNGNSNIAITSNANITLTANSNAVVAITSSGDGNAQTTGGNVTGYWNVSGNAVATNFIGKLANGNSNIAITANGNITLSSAGNAAVLTITGTTAVANSFTSNNYSLGNATNTISTASWFGASTTTTTPNQVLYQANAAAIASMDFHVTATDGTNSRQVSKILAVNLGTTTNYVEYGGMWVGPQIVDITVDQSGGNIRLLSSPLTANTIQYTIVLNTYN